MRLSPIRLVACSAIVATNITLSLAAVPTDRQDSPKPTVQRSSRSKAALAELDKKLQATNLVHAKIAGIKEALAKIAKDETVTKSDEGIGLMKALLKELTDLNTQVGQLRNEVDELKAWAEGQDENLPKLQKAVEQIQRFKPSVYMQFQYADSNQVDSAGNFVGTHSAAIRRLEIGGAYQVDNDTELKLSFDVATGPENRSAELKTAAVVHTLTGSNRPLVLTAGQFHLPLGYELPRSSSLREFPEHATYNRRLMSGERVRGAMLRQGITNELSAWAAGTGSLTVSDAEQVGKASMPFGRAAISGGLRYETKDLQLGVANFQGQRPSITGNPATSASVYRNFWYADATLSNLGIQGLELRAEAVWAHDRIPNKSAGPGAVGVGMSGWHTQLGYRLTPDTQLIARYGNFDPNTAFGGNVVTEYGVGLRYSLSKGSMVTLTQEWFKDPAITFDPTYQVTTLRYQVKF